MNFAVGLAAILFILYWLVLSKLVDNMLEKPRLKQAHWLLIGMLNAFVVFFAYNAWKNEFFAYYIMMLLMLIEFIVFYEDRFLSALLCTLACAIHVLSVFTITIGSLALISGFPPHEILANQKSFILSVTISFALLIMFTMGARKFVPLAQVKLINQHKEQQGFIVTWMAVNTAFLLYVASALSNTNYFTHVSGNQIATSIASMISLYIVLSFSFKTSSILGYKEKNAALEQAIYQEQQYRNSMVKDSLASYEINLTQDLVINGFEAELEAWGDKIFRYTDMLNLMSRKIIYSEDVEEFIQRHKRENIINRFENGDTAVTTEYRRLLDNGDYAWVTSTVNLVEDIENGDIKAFGCIRNIDAEKKKQMELQRLAERDPLTGLYNKSMTGKLIDEHLIFSQSGIASALFMIDVDNFKEINDYLGHIYGDAVLCELGEKIMEIFGDKNIAGRIGGDEFIVFLKDGATAEKVEEKAKAICEAFRITYKGQNGEEYSISSSVGISFFPRDGKNFKTLYSHADIALYECKNGGKSTYKIYEGHSFKGYTSQRTAIQTAGNVLQKGFRLNRIEYVFKMLYHSENSVAAIHSALELLASHFSFERGYIFETSKDGKTISNTFEWCAQGVTAEIDNLQKMPIETVATANSHFKESGTFVLKSLDELQPIERAVLEPQGIKSMFQFGIFDKNNWLGLIGFDNCKNEIMPSDTEIDEMGTICNILATFFVKQHIDEVAAKDLLARQEVMNHLDNYIYVIRRDTFEVLFMNDKIQKLIKESASAAVCYKFFRGNSQQCEDCPIRRLGDTETDRVTCEVYNEKLGIWMEATVSTMRWTDGSLASLINCEDITTQKDERMQHNHQLENIAYLKVLSAELIEVSSNIKVTADNSPSAEQLADAASETEKITKKMTKLIAEITGVVG